MAPYTDFGDGAKCEWATALYRSVNDRSPDRDAACSHQRRAFKQFRASIRLLGSTSLTSSHSSIFPSRRMSRR